MAIMTPYVVAKQNNSFGFGSSFITDTFIKEIIIANPNSTAEPVNVVIGGISVLNNFNVPANKTEVISMSTFVPASTAFQVSPNSKPISFYITGVKVE